MLRALNSAATGMEAQQMYIDVTSNNLANVNTTGFKKVRANFQDLMYQIQKAPGGATSQTTESPSGIQVGLGVRTASTQKEFTTGSLKNTGNFLDVAIEGDGFFQITQPDGSIGIPATAHFTATTTARWSTPAGCRSNPPSRFRSRSRPSTSARTAR